MLGFFPNFIFLTLIFSTTAMIKRKIWICPVGDHHGRGSGPNQPCPANQKGFTLIEVIAVMVIMGVMTSVATQKFGLLTDTASLKALESGIRELNTRETLAWAKFKLSDTGYLNDADVFGAIDKDLGPGFSWNPAPEIDNGTLHYKSHSAHLHRASSSIGSAGYWNLN